MTPEEYKNLKRKIDSLVRSHEISKIAGNQLLRDARDQRKEAKNKKLKVPRARKIGLF
jgi:hypothetical protein